jgi:hypothetical protein
MATNSLRSGILVQVEQLETREAPSATPWLLEPFDSTPTGQLPAGWASWTNGSTPFSVSAGQGVNHSAGLTSSTSLSSGANRAWLDVTLPSDLQVSASIYANTLIPAHLVARASGLDTATPTYYAVSLTRGLQVQLLRVVGGVTTPLAQLQSTSYVSSQWIQVTLSLNGSSLKAQVFRLDTKEYLTPTGTWQTAPVWALSASDTAITEGGRAGLVRPGSYVGTVAFDDFTITLPVTMESFDTTPVGSIPATWGQWNTSASTFAVSTARALSAPNGLESNATSSIADGRVWDGDPQPADVQVSAAVYLDSLIPARVFARGSGLNTASPSYYALSITRGLQVQLLRVVQGVATTLSQLSSASYVSNLWVRVTLQTNGTNLRAQVYCPEKAQYLNSSGQWQTGPTWALNLTDSSLSGDGLVGLERPASYTGALFFDDFSAIPASGTSVPPTVTITSPAPGSTLTGVISVQANASDALGVTKVEFYVDDVLRAAATAAPYVWDFDTSSASNGSHTLSVWAYDLAGNIGRASLTVTTQNNTALPQPNLPRHYSHIRIAELAFTGNPLGSVEDQLLQNSVDLVIPAVTYLAHIHSVAPNTPQLLYTNTSNIYLNLLTDWLNYADAHGLSREGAFYHVSTDTPFSGNSPSSEPVDWFWAVSRGGATLTDLTSQARGSNTGGMAFGAAGQSVNIGYPDRFRVINLNLASGAANGWSAVLEYPSTVDANGNPITWSTLPLLSDTTGGLTRSGQVLFDPPADWKTATINGSPRLYYVRYRTLTDGTAPRANTILGDDYVQAKGSTSGIIPAFDAAADTNHDGYLSDSEYAHHAAGKTARFLYQSRMFYPNYGQMRFATNPGDLGLRQWLVASELALLQSQPLADGLFVDNSGGNPPVSAAAVLEPVAAYSPEYGALLNAIAQAIAPKWILANTAGGGNSADAVIPNVQGYFEEFTLRPLSENYLQFQDVATQVAHRASLKTPAPYAVLDSLPAGGSPTDPRTQLATLAEYYLLADPVATFLDFFGGFAPATSWSQHWSPAVAYNIGQPSSTWSLFASGTDPGNPDLTYQVYQRSYTNALVLYKPLSYARSVTGTLSDNTATTFTLGGNYRLLQADGTPGVVVTSISLRNGEGAILIKA